MRMHTKHLAVILSVSALLAGCQSMREAMGVEKVVPDEFAIVTKAPLVVPPDFNLRPPQPGAPDRATVEPAEAARAALFTQQQTADTSLGSNYSEGEKKLLGSANAVDTPPDIRRTVSSESGYVNRGSDFTDKVLDAPATPSKE